MKIILWLDGMPVGSPSPATVVHELGIKYKKWEGQSVASQIQLLGVEPRSVPEDLPDFMDVVVDQVAETVAQSQVNRLVRAMLEFQDALIDMSGELKPQLLEIRVTPEMWHTLRRVPAPYADQAAGLSGADCHILGVVVHPNKSQ